MRTENIGAHHIFKNEKFGILITLDDRTIAYLEMTISLL
jgi:hypothetical protein